MFNLSQAKPFKFRDSNADAFVVRAIQNAYYSIKCIAESTLSGREMALERGVTNVAHALLQANSESGWRRLPWLAGNDESLLGRTE